MPVNPINGPQIFPAPESNHSRRTSFSEHVEEVSFDNSLPPHESVEAARIRSKLMKQPLSPVVQSVPQPQFTQQTVIRSVSSKPRLVVGVSMMIGGFVLAVAGVGLGPAAVIAGVVLCLSGLALAESATKLVVSRSKPPQVVSQAVIDAIDLAHARQDMTLDLRQHNVYCLPDWIAEARYLHFVIVNKESAKYLPKNIDGIEIIGR